MIGIGSVIVGPRGRGACMQWLDNCVPKSAAAQGDLDAEDAGAAALEGA